MASKRLLAWDGLLDSKERKGKEGKESKKGQKHQYWHPTRMTA